MKKLMITAAALCAAVCVSAIESANTVGYQEIPAPQGSSLRCPTFRTVLAANYPLSEIKVTGADGTGDVCAQVVSSEGVWDGEYYYLTEDNTGMPDGWYKDMFGGESADDIILSQGTALFISSANNDLVLTVAGQVAIGDVLVPFSQGAGMVGNCLPVDVDLANIGVTGADGTGDVCAQTIGSDGVWAGEYYYLTEDNTGMPDGWYKDMFGIEAVDDVTLAPGESLFVTSANNDVTFVFPAAIAE